MTTKNKQTSRKPVKTSAAKKKPRGRPFQKNDPESGFIDPRINRTGLNAKFTEFHRMLDNIFGEILEYQIDADHVGKMTVLENMTRGWIVSGDYNKQAKALEYLVGKVPDEIRVNSDMEGFIKANVDLLTDGQIDRLKRGESPGVILGELLTELKAIKKKE